MKLDTQCFIFSLGIILIVAICAFADEENMILIPAGEFTMGSETRAADEKPAHKVYLDAYYLGKYEVTNEEYYKFWKATGKPKGEAVGERSEHTPESFGDEYDIGAWPDRVLKFPSHPVVGVSWHDAVAYAEWMDMRLPTEAEWEKAARGASDRLWPWGNSPRPNANTWNGKDGYDNKIAPVESYPKGKSYYGVMDMAGNVWEWTSDWYSDTYYFHSPKQNPTGAGTGSWRVIRGGAWTDDINRCTTTFRFYFYPSLKTSFIGFRLARTAESSSSSKKSKQK